LAKSTFGRLPLVNLSDVEATEVTWLWDRRIAKGKLSLLVGDGGVGKSFLTLYLAAQISRGDALPDDATQRQSANVLIITAEDAPDDTIKPRLQKMNADVGRIDVLQSIDLHRDLWSLEQAIRSRNISLVIIDPLNAYMGNKDSHKDAEVRAVLTPLSALAIRTGTAVLGIMHLSKNTKAAAQNRPQGSTAFVNTARSAWWVSPDQDDPELRLLVNMKSNLAKPAASLAYRIVDGSVVFESGTIDVTADDLARQSLDGGASELARAVELLNGLLGGGDWVPSKDVAAKAKDAGISFRTLVRARKQAKVRSRKMADGRWMNYIDEVETAAAAAAGQVKQLVGTQEEW